MHFGVIIMTFINLFIIWLYHRLPKSLTILETIGCFLIIVIFIHDWINLTVLNLDMIKLPKELDKSIIFVINKVVLFPLTSLLFLNFYLFFQSVYLKVAIFVLGIMTLVLIDNANTWLGIIQHLNWSIWKSSLLWGVLGVLLFWSQRIFKFFQDEN